MKKWLALITILLSSYALAYTTDELNKIADNLNKDYPTMVDKITKITKVTVDATTFTYHYVLIDKSVNDIDVPKFNDLMKANLTKSVCSDNFAMDVFKSNFNIAFDYADKDNKPITTINFKPGDCPAPTSTTPPPTPTPTT